FSPNNFYDYTGNTVVNKGTLTLIDGANISQTSAVDVGSQHSNGATLNLQTGSQLISSGPITLATAGGSGKLNAQQVRLGASTIARDLTGQQAIVNFDGTTLAISENGVLFDGFRSDKAADSEAPDSIMLQTNGVNIEVAENKITRQYDKASMTGEGSLIKSGKGQLVLRAVNTFKGHTDILAGSLKLAVENTLPSNSPIFIAQGANVTIEMENQGDNILPNTLSGNGDLIKRGPGTTTLSANNLPFTGDIYIKQGTIYAEHLSQLGSGQRIIMGEQQDFGTLTLNLAQNDSLNRHLIGQGHLLKQDNHILTFSKDYQYTYSGDTDVQAGEIVLAKGANIPNSAIKMASATVLRAETGSHAIGALSLADKTNQVNIVANSFNDYSQLHAQGAVTLNGQLMVDASAWNTPVAGNGKLPNVITSQQQLSGQFSSYQDNSALFDFVPEYDYANKAMHLVINHAANCANTSAG
ncbi:hypothetical protein QV09_12220, partial [Gallibacterium salpingitidis]